MEFQLLYKELSNSTEMIRSLLPGISQNEAQYQPRKGAWSILEVVCHLYDEEREDFREHLDFILNRQDEEWHAIDPQGWVKTREYNQQNFKIMQRKFFKEREKSLVWLESIKNADWKMVYRSQFGSMKAGDMFASWVAHDNLHIRQLVELRRAYIERITQPHKTQYAGDW